MLKRALFLIVVVAGCKSDKPDAAAPEKPADPTPVAPAAKTPDSPKPALPPVDDSKPTADTPRMHRHEGGSAMSDDDRKAARHARAESMRTKLDANGDGKLTPDELAAATGRMHFDDPKALDTDHDGNISADELEAGMAARRAQRRANRGGGGGGGSADPGDEPTTP